MALFSRILGATPPYMPTAGQKERLEREGGLIEDRTGENQRAAPLPYGAARLRTQAARRGDLAARTT